MSKILKEALSLPTMKSRSITMPTSNNTLNSNLHTRLLDMMSSSSSNININSFITTTIINIIALNKLKLKLCRGKPKKPPSPPLQNSATFLNNKLFTKNPLKPIWNVKCLSLKKPNRSPSQKDNKRKKNQRPKRKRRSEDPRRKKSQNLYPRKRSHRRWRP